MAGTATHWHLLRAGLAAAAQETTQLAQQGRRGKAARAATAGFPTLGFSHLAAAAVRHLSGSLATNQGRQGLVAMEAQAFHPRLQGHLSFMVAVAVVVRHLLAIHAVSAVLAQVTVVATV
jgi:hypothetical protein